MYYNLENFEQLYEKYFERLLAFILYRVNTQEDAEDLNSILWEKILKNLKKFRGENERSFEAFAFKAARNLVIDFYRTNEKYKKNVDLEKAFDIKENIDIAADSKDKEDIQKLFDLVEKLPKTQKEVFRLRHLDGFQNKEIASLLQMDERTVSSNLARAKKFLKDSFIKCSNYLASIVLIIVAK